MLIKNSTLTTLNISSQYCIFVDDNIIGEGDMGAEIIGAALGKNNKLVTLNLCN